jgi:glucosylceramidase
VKPRASLIEVSDNQDVLAFKNPDGKIVIVIANRTTTDKPQLLKVDDKYLDVVLKANSFNTIVF